ncbi:hypothetical protein CEV34_1283 [Brucella pseudogrignonensis]|uniref:Uncharacterized protein n=1 Tax=Brucella pseudogrignonensis TaxID=419475 RepID=A0A256GNX7_9HYPH|nr:hypothetical protein CEV34_1283 [Brucella pseudogrignonensis]
MKGTLYIMLSEKCTLLHCATSRTIGRSIIICHFIDLI